MRGGRAPGECGASRGKRRVRLLSAFRMLLSVFAIGLISGCGTVRGEPTKSPTPAATSIRSAVNRCLKHRGATYHVVLSGYFRPGAPGSGPGVFGGTLFGSDSVPRDAWRHIRTYGGVLFGIIRGSPLSRNSQVIRQILRPHALIRARGPLRCGYGPPSWPDLTAHSVVVSDGTVH